MNKMIRLITILIFIISSIISIAQCQDTSGLQQSLMDKVSDVVNIQSLNETAGNQVEEVKNKLKEKCLKNGGIDAFDKLNSAKDDLEKCVKSLFNITELQKEIEEAKPNGNLDLVFKEYCKKKNRLTSCLSKFMSTMELCLDTKERESPKIIRNVTDSILDFICFKEGDRIALFIAHEGPECFQSQQEGIQKCVNSTYGGYLPATNPNIPASLETLPNLMFGLQECSDLNKLEKCVVQTLNNCKNPTPSNIAEALFEFLKKVTPCENVLKTQMDAQSQQASSAVNLFIQSALIITTTFVFSFI